MVDSGIYQIVRRVLHMDDKFYIGASRNLKKRIQSHLNGNTHIELLARDIDKYGIENFTGEVLLRCTEKELSKLEKEVIADYCDFGYELYNYKASKANRPINVSTDVFRELKKIRLEISSNRSDGRIVTFNEVIKELLAEREEYLK